MSAIAAAVGLLLSPGAAAAAPVRVEVGSLQQLVDYPAEAMREGQQGVVRFDLRIDTEGRVTDCLITASSGSGLLDANTCRSVMHRAHFRPARDAAGNAVPAIASSSISYSLAPAG
ncbi:MAG TPA: energy transducer TonB [Allosphingosinicella sp.]|jgi:protein TonB